MKSFLGHVTFYRQFIKDFSNIAKLLTRLLIKDMTFVFNEECLSGFQRLKEASNASPRLRPFEVMCDASDYAVGTILGQ